MKRDKADSDAIGMCNTERSSKMAHTKRFWLKCSAGLPLLAPYLFFFVFGISIHL